MNFDKQQISQIRSDLSRRQRILVDIARDQSIPITARDRDEIILYLEKGELPARPESVPDLMMVFVSSCFTYAPLRAHVERASGLLLSRHTICECLARIFDADSFRLKDTWEPKNLRATTERIQVSEQYDLDSRQFNPRMVCVLLDGSLEMGRQLEDGVIAFFKSLDLTMLSGTEHIWKFVHNLAGPIRHVGDVLICDFLKECGYAQFVKVDHHFRREFPGLIGRDDDCGKLSAKMGFMLTQELSAAVGMTPYRIDKILYEWGRCGRHAHGVNP